MLVEIARSADWAGGLVLVNGHGGNRAGVDAAVRRITDEGRAVLSWWPRVERRGRPCGPDRDIDHARAGDRDAVRLEQPCPGTAVLRRRRSRPSLRAASPTGIVGDPIGASADEGRALLDALATDLIATVSRWERSR